MTAPPHSVLAMGSAPAKIILLGEHAAVYGMPAIAVPLSNLRAYATAEPSHRPGLYIAAEDLGEVYPVNIVAVDTGAVIHSVQLTAKLTLDALKTMPPDALIRLRSDIPIASGLGSGAAVTTALARVLCVLTDRTLPDADLNALVYQVEKIYHGTPSGIDNTVIVYERPIFFIREQPFQSLRIGGDFHLVVGDTGIGASTKVAVADVASLYQHESARIAKIFEAIGALVIDARNALEMGDARALGEAMTRNHAHLQSLTVSSPELDHMVDAVLGAGAYGAKLSGGGRGGNMIALVPPEKIVPVGSVLRAAGAARVFSTVLKKES